MRLAKVPMNEPQIAVSYQKKHIASLRGLLFCVFLSVCSPFARPAQDPNNSPGQGYPEDAAHRDAQKAATRGDKADAAGHTEEAWKDYQEASRLVPTDKEILERTAALRSKLVRQHVEMAERYALEIRMDEAAKELNKALLIDPGDTFVAQRLQEMKSLDDELPPQPKPGEGFPSLKVKPGKKNFNLRGDTKTVFDQVAQQFGITVSFDSDLTTHNVKFRADDVDFRTAMSLLEVQTGTFYRPLEPTLMFVAANTPDKRKQYAMEGQQIFPLPASVGPEDMTELLRVLRDITDSTHIELDSNSRSITMRDTPQKLKLAGEIIQQVEKVHGEIMLDIQLLEVDKGTARNLGITWPFPIQATLLDAATGHDAGRGHHRSGCAHAIGRHPQRPGNFQPALVSSGGRRKQHVPVDHGFHGRQFFRFAFPAPQRPRSIAARAERQTSHFLRGRSLSHHAFVAFRQLDGRRTVHYAADRSFRHRQFQSHQFSAHPIRRGPKSFRAGSQHVYQRNSAGSRRRL